MSRGAGARRFRVSLQAPSGTSGYVEQAQEWASIRPAGGSEQLQFGGTSASGRYVVEMPFRSDLRAEWQLVDGQGRTFQIANYSDPDGRRVSLQVFCQELQ